MTAPIRYTAALDLACLRCSTPAGTYCNGAGVGADLCQERINAAAKQTRAANAAARKACGERDF